MKKNELDEKAQKLSLFISESPIFAALNSEEKGLLQQQYEVMREYSEILTKRIALF